MADQLRQRIELEVGTPGNGGIPRLMPEGSARSAGRERKTRTPARQLTAACCLWTQLRRCAFARSLDPGRP